MLWTIRGPSFDHDSAAKVGSRQTGLGTNVPVNRGFQAIAAEMTSYSKKAFDEAIRTWEEPIGVKSVQQAAQIQADYVKKAYENHMAELSKLREICVGVAQAAYKPAEETSRKFR